MKLICQLFRKLQNSTKIHGICVKLANATPPVDASSSSASESAALSQNENRSDDDHFGAGTFIVVVICFYSLSIVFLTLFNIRFKIVFSRSYGICCCRESSRDQHYESQKEETKTTIHMLFRDSSRLLPAVALTNSYLLTAAFSDKMSNAQANETKSATTMSAIKLDNALES